MPWLKLRKLHSFLNKYAPFLLVLGYSCTHLCLEFFVLNVGTNIYLFLTRLYVET